MAKSHRPVVPEGKSGNKPVIQSQTHRIDWIFSFKYFKEIEFFGLGAIKPSWTSSFLERLKDISKYDVKEFHEIQNKSIREGIRYHPINWEAKEIPIKKSDINWLDKEMQENIDEIIFYQFHISKAIGRVVGFWGEEKKVFYITLLDPLHNLQPSKDYGYTVTPCHPPGNSYEFLVKKIEEAIGKNCSTSGCRFVGELRAIFNSTEPESHNVILIHLDDDYKDNFYEMVSSTTPSEYIKDQVTKYVCEK